MIENQDDHPDRELVMDISNVLLTIRSGLKTAIPQTPTPALAVP